MTATEFSNQFDVLYNNIMSNAAPGLNEYEKSIFLTKAQNTIILNYFNPKSKGNAVQEGFDDSPIRQADFSTIIKTSNIPYKSLGPDVVKIDPRSRVYSSTDKIYIIINEMLVDPTPSFNGVRTRQVIPINYQEYIRLMSKPFKEPLKWQAWRLTNNSTNEVFKAEIITTTTDRNINWTYCIRYVKKPVPIILTDLASAYGENLSIDGYTSGGTVGNNCTGVDGSELPEIMHEAILQKAVELAKAAYSSDQNGQLQYSIQNAVSQTNE